MLERCEIQYTIYNIRQKGCEARMSCEVTYYVVYIRKLLWRRALEERFEMMTEGAFEGKGGGRGRGLVL